MFKSLSRLATIAFLAAPAAASTPSISVKGAKFFTGNEQFLIKGVAYQGTPADPLLDPKRLQFDVDLMKILGVNSLRVYHVDASKNHDDCMKILSDAGMYLWLDLSTFDTSIVEDSPKWTEYQFSAFTSIVDAFQHYDNLAGFWVGNENINSKNGSMAAPYIKAAIADIKTYLSTKNYRKIPIGYSAADIAELRPMVQNYLACGPNSEQSLDFFGLNSYEWCGQATYDSSGYHWLEDMAKSYPVPMFFSETGCNVGGQRTFNDQTAIFGPDMESTWSGSIIYEWVQETNNYGLVNYPDEKIYSGAPIPIHPDFENLANHWRNLNPLRDLKESYTPTLTPPECPTPTLGWLVNGDVPIPTLHSSFVSSIPTLRSSLVKHSAQRTGHNPGNPMITEAPLLERAVAIIAPPGAHPLPVATPKRNTYTQCWNQDKGDALPSRDCEIRVRYGSKDIQTLSFWEKRLNETGAAENPPRSSAIRRRAPLGMEAWTYTALVVGLFVCAITVFTFL